MRRADIAYGTWKLPTFSTSHRGGFVNRFAVNVKRPIGLRTSRVLAGANVLNRLIELKDANLCLVVETSPKSPCFREGKFVVFPAK